MDAYDEWTAASFSERREVGVQMMTLKTCMKYSARFKNDESNGSKWPRAGVRDVGEFARF